MALKSHENRTKLSFRWLSGTADISETAETVQLQQPTVQQLGIAARHGGFVKFMELEWWMLMVYDVFIPKKCWFWQQTWVI